MHLLTPVENEALRSASSFFTPRFCSILLAIASLTALNSCGSGAEEMREMSPSDFGFEWDDDGAQFFSSAPGIYTRKTVAGDTSVYLGLDNSRMALLWNVINSERFLDLPSKLECKPGVPWVVPAPTSTITIWVGGDTSRIEDEGGCTEPLDPDAARRFERVEVVIDSLLNSIPEIQSLPGSGMLLL